MPLCLHVPASFDICGCPWATAPCFPRRYIKQQIEIQQPRGITHLSDQDDKLSLLIALVVTALTVLAQPSPDPTKAQGNGQSSEQEQDCTQLCKEAKLKNPKDTKKCNRVFCNPKLLKACTLPTCKKYA
ncbi:predicted protein [Lichtheimia corymbifera JMRC:FSU:9682]|uniref:Uncharacterized protein n=1 Tax=Lichtheimia corymbifera JMRC:FSU:9682 TaxID=1263082 RepID=A0A068RYD6_9FUNG|nr:predicted protein [Lichtheimia corymbifera JMRC:FSU:9682]